MQRTVLSKLRFDEAAKGMAEALWQRFRLLAMVIDKIDSFAGMTPGGAPVESQRVGSGASGGWLQSLVQNPQEARAIASDLVLRTLRVAVEPGNVAILRQLQQQPSASFSELMQATRLNRLSVNERVNDLIQAGLAVKDIQSGQVQGTQAAEALITLVQQTEEALFNLILKRLKGQDVP